MNDLWCILEGLQNGEHYENSLTEVLNVMDIKKSLGNYIKECFFFLNLVMLHIVLLFEKVLIKDEIFWSHSQTLIG